MENQMLEKILKLGQSVWLDNLSRQIINSGELKSLITDKGVRGLTSNPAIFQKAISGSDAYESDIEKFTNEGLERKAIYERLAVADIQRAADLFRPVYDSSNGEDGYVSLEVQPALVYDTEGTIEEARRLWSSVDRPNVMIKVPGTKEGLPAITQLLGEGININVTLLFNVDRYRDVTTAYLDGLQLCLDNGGSIKNIASVASFFLSRIDVMVDPMLKDIIQNKPDQAEKAKSVLGETAIANAKDAYKVFQEVFSSERFQKLEKEGARKQRVLWASTGNKNPDYEDLRYVHPLIGPDTVNTMPDQTLEILLEKGEEPKNTVADGMDHASKVLATLDELGIDIKKVTDDLEKEGVDKFEKPFDQLLDTIEEQRKAHA
uniref:Transaldolase n=1 Tax=Roseihalotalea indica TaxID=2867963 RepID=A0AA49GSX3_9BACT|nr:transaldolase [Tunicatimonas sp. TK19036]